MLTFTVLSKSVHKECARKKKAKIPQSQSARVFFVRCRRIYFLNKFIEL